MGYATVAEVKSTINFPSTGAPVIDSDINSFISYAEEEIENIYHTKFGNIEKTGTATSGTTTTITVSGTPYTIDEYIDYVVWIIAGTNSGEYRKITTNTVSVLTVSSAFSAAIDDTSQFRITKLGYKSETVDGTGEKVQFVQYQPLIKLNSLTIDSTSVTPSSVYQYETGRLVMSTSAEVCYFSNNTPQLIDLEYIYGVYPMPRIIKRLCILLASIRTLTAQISGTYDDFTSVNLPGGFTGSKGEPYMNIREAVTGFQGEAKGIIYGTKSEGAVTGDLRTSASYCPFTIFG